MIHDKKTDKAFFLFYGDLIKSHGTATYLSSFLKYMNTIWNRIDILLYQAHLPNINFYPKGSGLPDPSKAPLSDLYPYIPRIIWRLHEILCCYFQLGICLLRGKGAGESTVLICGEVLLPAVLLSRFINYKWIYVKMGIIEELCSNPQGLNMFKYKIIRVLEKNFLPEFDTIIVVSKVMGEYLQKKYHILSRNISVIPCAVDNQTIKYRPFFRNKIRRDLELQNRIIFVYCGTWAPWQCIRETIACFKAIKELEEKAFFLILSPDGILFQRYLSSLNRRDYRVIYVPHSRIDRYLSAADCGFLLRKRDIINRVSSPLKFSEYLICGLPVIIGPEVGDYSSLVKEKSIGLIIDPDRPDEWEKKLLPFIKQVADNEESIKKSCVDIAINRFSWQAISYRMKRLQNKITSHNKELFILLQ